MICPHCKNEPQFASPHPEGMLKQYHPLAGEGYTPETGWTHPEAERLSKKERRTRSRMLALRSWRLSAKAKHTPEVTHGA